MQVHNAKDIDIVMPMYNLIQNSDNSLDTSGSLLEYCRYEPSLNNVGNVIDFTGANHKGKLFWYKQKITSATVANGTKNIEIMLPLTYVSNFSRTLKMPLINCEINLFLTWSKNCVIAPNTAANENIMFVIRDTNLYVPVVALSTQYNSQLLQQLKSGFKRTINWNK